MDINLYEYNIYICIYGYFKYLYVSTYCFTSLIHEFRWLHYILLSADHKSLRQAFLAGE